MITSTSKIVCVLMAFLFGASPQSSQTLSKMPVETICTQATPLTFGHSFYQAQTRKSLERLGESNHPVGLYWLAQRDLREANTFAAIEKLESAAKQGLADAYFRLAEIYASKEQHSQAEDARLCGDVLEAKTSQP